MLELSPLQLFIIGAAASLISSLISWLIQTGLPWIIKVIWKKPVAIDLGRWVKTIIVGLVAGGLAWWWFPVGLPMLPTFSGTIWNQIGQFVNWLPVLAAALSPYFGTAVALYNLLLGYITDPDRRAKIIQSLLDWLGISPAPAIGPGSIK